MDPSDNFDETPSETDPSERRPGGAVRIGLGVTAVAVVGALLFAVTRQPAPPSVQQAVSRQEAALQVAATEESGAQLLEAQRHVAELEAQLLAGEQKLLDVATAAGVEPDELAKTDLAAEVASLRGNLLAARKVRDRLRVDLKSALAQVEALDAEAALARDEATRAHEEATLARGDATAARGEATLALGEANRWKTKSVRSQWKAFAATVANEFCDHGTGRGVDNCQESLDAYFTEARFERFAACISSGGAAPRVLPVPADQSAPPFSEQIGSKKLLARQDWYVVYCDPTLPNSVQPLATAQ